MKTVHWLLCCCLFGATVLCVNGFAASAEIERLEIVDQVYERSTDGSYLQIGDYAIVEVNNVWQETTPGDITPIPLRRIKTGATVKVRIIPHANEGVWVAEDLYLLSAGEQEEATNKPSSGEIFMEDGTWKN